MFKDSSNFINLIFIILNLVLILLAVSCPIKNFKNSLIFFFINLKKYMLFTLIFYSGPFRKKFFLLESKNSLTSLTIFL